MEILAAIFGTEGHVGLAQECARAVLVFIYGLVMLRLSGRRTFAEWTALDVIITVMAGAVLGRAMAGSGSLPGAMAAVAVLVMLHRAVSYAVAKSEVVARVIEAAPVMLARNGVLDEAARCRHNVSLSELAAAMRAEGLTGLEEIGKVRAMVLEPTGEIHVLKRAHPG